jgi:hypothetical protein
VRVLVTGSRDWPDLSAIWADLATVHLKTHNEWMTVVHGASVNSIGRLRGADRWADEWVTRCQALNLNVTVERHYAANFGGWPECGPLRNRHMVSLGADLVLAYPLGESRGTRGCIALARAAGLLVYDATDGPLALNVTPDGTFSLRENV